MKKHLIPTIIYFIAMIGIIVSLTGCKKSNSTTLTVTVEETGVPVNEATVILEPPSYGTEKNEKIDSFEGTTDENGKVRFLIKEWGAGTSYGIVLYAKVLKDTIDYSFESGTNTIVIRDPGTNGQYGGKNFNHTIKVKK